MFLEEYKFPSDLQDQIIDHFTTITMDSSKSNSMNAEQGELTPEGIFKSMSH